MKSYKQAQIKLTEIHEHVSVPLVKKWANYIISNWPFFEKQPASIVRKVVSHANKKASVVIPVLSWARCRLYAISLFSGTGSAVTMIQNLGCQLKVATCQSKWQWLLADFCGSRVPGCFMFVCIQYKVTVNSPLSIFTDVIGGQPNKRINSGFIVRIRALKVFNNW